MESLLTAADRMWDAAWALDEVRGDYAASNWTGRKVRDLMREGEADNPEKIARLADALERRLERERTAGPESGGQEVAR